MIIVRLLSPSPLVGFSTTQVYSGIGADIVMESITLKTPAPANRRRKLARSPGYVSYADTMHRLHYDSAIGSAERASRWIVTRVSRLKDQRYGAAEPCSRRGDQRDHAWSRIAF